MTRWHFFYSNITLVSVRLKKCQFHANGIISDQRQTSFIKLLKHTIHGIEYSTFSR